MLTDQLLADIIANVDFSTSIIFWKGALSFD
jgi:hypothetical protein